MVFHHVLVGGCRRLLLYVSGVYIIELVKHNQALLLYTNVELMFYLHLMLLEYHQCTMKCELLYLDVQKCNHPCLCVKRLIGDNLLQI